MARAGGANVLVLCQALWPGAAVGDAGLIQHSRKPPPGHYSGANMHRFVLLCLLLLLPLSWASAVSVQDVVCVGAQAASAPTGSTLASGNGATTIADDAPAQDTPSGSGCGHCGDEGSACQDDCPCQSAPSPGALHHRPTAWAACGAQPLCTHCGRPVPEPFAATPLRPPSAHRV